ncbi:MAG: cobalamin biosynthetic protein CobC [Pseudohongiellaceae bacterium]
MLSRHGGNLVAASAEFGIPVEQWIDLSTGISPWVWPVPSIPDAVWQRLPYENNDLEIAAALAYGCSPSSVLAVPGSQYAIHKIPGLVSSLVPLIDRAPVSKKVAIPAVGYREHKQSWGSAGYDILFYASETQLLEILNQELIQFAVVINPNNPTTQTMAPQTLLLIASKLAARRGFLIVDEAFADVAPEFSVSHYCPSPGLLVLRSIGKFFGLAGIRLGFVLGDPDLLAAIKKSLPIWTVTTVSRWLGEQALSDCDWQLRQQNRLKAQSEEWMKLIAIRYPSLSLQLNPLFVTAASEAKECLRIYQSLAKLGILVRLFTLDEGFNGIRFGLPSESECQEFEKRLSESPNLFA